MTAAYTLFDTAIGRVGIAWGEHGILALQLPERTDEATRTRLLRRAGDAAEGNPPRTVQVVIDDIVALMRGDKRDLSGVALDMARVPDFNRQVYAIARTIPAGETMTYGTIAKELGDVALSRDVGQALGQNPFPIVVPCHRVLAAGGKSGGFSASGGAQTKLRMLSIERARTGDQPTLFDSDPSFGLRAGAPRQKRTL